ncbi:MAG TPA: GYF domain-containing protein [Vulgatibacter sp.]|nr:GYF domain-containing protein [Vulgatibacter sp.]
MKFACDRCRAQYMISDEKVRPNGVKVRCKKCGHVIVVKRPSSEVPVVAPTPAAPAPFETLVGEDGKRRSGSLDDEIGAAFETMLSGSPGPAASEPEAAPSPTIEEDPGKWLDELTGPASEPAQEAKPAEQPKPAPQPPPDADWFLAIDGEQVGPIKLDALEERWDRSEIGPDTLCWRSGLVEWTPLSQVEELAGVLAPLPKRKAPREDPEVAPRAAAPADPAAPEPWEKPTPSQDAAASEGFRPAAASALASLVEKEIEAARKPDASAPATDRDVEEPRPGIESTGIRMLLRSLPEAPPGEPSKFIPLQRSPDADAPARAAEAPAGTRRSKALVAAVVATVIAVPAAAVGTWFVLKPNHPPAEASVASRQEAPRKEEPPAPEKVAAAEERPEDEAKAGEAKAAAVAEEAKAAADGEADAAEKAEEEEEAKVAAAEKETEEAKVADAKAAEVKEAPPKRPARSAGKVTPSRREPPRTSRASRRDPPPAEDPAPPRRGGKGDDLLAAARTRSIDALFEKEFAEDRKPAQRGSSPTYIPPAPGSGNALPVSLGQGDITGVVVGHKAEIKRCVTEYKNVGGAESGTLVMRWTIEQNGTTSGIRPTKGAEHEKLARCVGDLIKGWRFPAYSGPKMAPIDFPFQF